jgi:hypothetical protein
MSNIGSNSEFRDAFLEGAARAMFVCAYASFDEEADSTDNELTDEERACRQDLPRPGPREDWYDYAPETPLNAYALAGEMWTELCIANAPANVYVLAQRATDADGSETDPEEFGRLLAMQYMGHGVSWFDDHKTFPIEIPHAEISEFSFDSKTYFGGEP